MSLLNRARTMWESGTHVIDLPRPSHGDLTTLAGIILDPEYNFSSFAMILAVVGTDVAKLLAYTVALDDSERYRNNGKLVKVTEVIPDVREREEAATRAQEGGI